MTMVTAQVHPTALVEEGATIGPGTRIWHRAHVREHSRIGADCTVGFCAFVDTEVTIGDRCKIQNHANLYRGVTLGDEVFVGPAVTFTNDLYPRAEAQVWEVIPTVVERGASIGANATIVCGIRIGRWATVGAGAVVTKDVPPHALVLGSPARVAGWMCRCGARLTSIGGPIVERCSVCDRVVDPIVRSS